MTDYVRLLQTPSTWLLSPRALSATRLDASFYEPKYLDVSRQLDEMPVGVQPFRRICSKLNCGSTPKNVVYGDAGMGLIRTTNVRPNSYDPTDTLRVPGMRLPLEGNRTILPGDVLYTMSGTVGFAAVYPAALDAASFSNTIARGRIRKEMGHDPYYVAAFLNSSLGYSQSMRLVSGGVLGHVMPNPLRDLRIVTPGLEVQRAIGNVFRKAESLRLLAFEIRSSVAEELATAFGSMPPGFAGDASWVESAELSGSRLDAWFHQRSFLSAVRLFELRSDLIEVRSLCGLGTTLANVKSWPTENFSYFEIGGLNPETGEAVPTNVHRHDAPSRAKYQVMAGDLLVSTVRPNLRAIGQVSARCLRAVCSSGFCVLRPKSPAIGAYVRACLVQDAATMQLMRWNTGATYPAIERSIPCSVRIPDLGQDRIREIGEDLLKANQHTEEAADLVSEALADIENVVSGRMDAEMLIMRGECIQQWLTANQRPKAQKESRRARNI